MPPPKLVAPMTRKVQKMEPSDTRAGAPGDSLMMAWRRRTQAVDDSRLGQPEGEPAARIRLQPAVESVRPLAGLRVHVRVALELALVGELADQRRTDGARAPQRHRRFRRQAVPEVEHAAFLEHLGDPRPLHDLEWSGAGQELPQRREHLRRARHVLLQTRRRQREDDVVGEQAARAPGMPLLRQHLLLELDPEVVLGCGSDVDLCRLVELGMAELERQLRIADRPPVTVLDALPEDEGRLVQIEVRRVVEDDLPQQALVGADRAHDLHALLLGRSAHDPPELVQRVARREAIRPQDQLVLPIVHRVRRMSIGHEPARPSFGFGHRRRLLFFSPPSTGRASCTYPSPTDVCQGPGGHAYQPLPAASARIALAMSPLTVARARLWAAASASKLGSVTPSRATVRPERAAPFGPRPAHTASATTPRPGLESNRRTLIVTRKAASKFAAGAAATRGVPSCVVRSPATTRAMLSSSGPAQRLNSSTVTRFGVTWTTNSGRSTDEGTVTGPTTTP